MLARLRRCKSTWLDPKAPFAGVARRMLNIKAIGLDLISGWMKVKAHRSEPPGRQVGSPSLRDWAGNMVADKLAGAGARLHPRPTQQVEAAHIGK